MFHQPSTPSISATQSGFTILLDSGDCSGHNTGSRSRLCRLIGIESQLAEELRLSKRMPGLSEAGEEEPESLRHGDEVCALAFGPDDCTLVAAGEDKTVVVWDVPNRWSRARVSMDSAVVAVNCSSAAGSNCIAAAAASSKVVVWDISPSLKEPAELGSTLVDGEPLVLTSSFCGHQELLVVGTASKKAVILSMPDLQTITQLLHDGPVQGLALTACSSSSSSAIRGQGPPVLLLACACGGGSASTKGKQTSTIHSSSSDGTDGKSQTALWHVSVAGADCRYTGSVLSDVTMHTVAFAPAGGLLAVGGDRTSVVLLDVTGACSGSGGEGCEKVSELSCAAGVRCLAWSPNSRLLASGRKDAQVSIFDVLTGTMIVQLPTAAEWLCAVAFSRDCKLLATCGFGDEAVRLHPLQTEDDCGTGEPGDIEATPLPRISVLHT